MRAPRAVLVLLFCSALAACERSTDPVIPAARPSLDSGVTLGGGGKTDSTSVGTQSTGSDSTTVNALDSGVFIGSGG